jgi:hypothetical protein
MKSSAFFLLASFFAIFLCVPAMAVSPHISLQSNFDEEYRPFIQMLIIGPAWKVFITNGADVSPAAGLQNPLFGLGAFYQKGLLRLIENPRQFAPDNRVFTEKTGFELKTAPAARQGHTLILAPVPDNLCFFFIDEPDERKMMGADVRLPWAPGLATEFLLQKSCADSRPADEAWFSDDRRFDGSALYNLAMKVNADCSPFSGALYGGCSLSDLYRPGFFLLLHAVLEWETVSVTATTGYQSQYYFAPSGAVRPAGLDCGAVLKWKPANWLALAARGGMSWRPIGPLSASFAADAYRAGVSASCTIRFSKLFSAELELLFDYAACLDTETAPPDCRLDASLQFRLASYSAIQFRYSYRESENENGHVLTAALNLSQPIGDLSFRLKYSVLDARLSGCCRGTVKMCEYHVNLELEQAFVDWKPEGKNALKLNVSLAYAL